MVLVPSRLVKFWSTPVSRLPAYTIDAFVGMYSVSPSNKRTVSKSGKKRNNKQSGTGSQAPPVSLRSVPTVKNATIRIRRSVSRIFQLNGAAGIDGYPYSTMQVTFSPGATNWRIGGTSIYADSLPNFTEFSALFDQYKVERVYLRFDLPPQYFNSGLTTIIPLVQYVSDYDDGGDATKTDLQQYPQYQVHSFLKDGYTPLIFTLSPKPLRDIAGSGVATSYGPMTSVPWIRTAEMSTPHYGIKLNFDFLGTTFNVSIPLEVTVSYDLALTNPK